MKPKLKRYPCHSDKYVDTQQILEHAIDEIKLCQLHGKEVSVHLAISHMLNYLERTQDDL